MSTQAIAQVIGPLYVVIALSVFTNSGLYKKMLDDLRADNPLIFTHSLMAFVLGLVIVLHHNTWNTFPEIVVSLIGWLALLKGIAHLLFTEDALRLAKRFKENTQQLGVVALVIGGYLMWVGYFA